CVTNGKWLEKPWPVDRQDGNLRSPMTQHLLQCLQTLFRCNVAYALGRPLAFATAAQGGCHAHFSPWSPVDTHRREGLPTPLMGQSIHKSIGCCVVPLASCPQQGSHRGKEHEKVQRQMLGQRVQVPGAVHLWCHHLRKTCPGLLQQHTVIEDPGSMDDA